ncbi:hypothetical protein P886_0264 [Alteromonadaceae bacterium 2753L.S.0a.02]|nr:hypothetical protein P886_0264 [Alteromonadaceae bacterium 2753L.S.0a.02]
MPLTAFDQRDITRYNLKQGRTDHRGNQLWSSWARHDAAGNYETNEYFYRAMSLAELDSYRNRFSFDQIAGHQGWAPYRAYSLAYLDTRSIPQITRLVEAHLPGFVRRMKEEGWFIGKIEAGCFSWGIGSTQSNGWRGSRGLRARHKNEALHPWDIFHETLKAVRVVDLMVAP